MIMRPREMERIIREVQAQVERLAADVEAIKAEALAGDPPTPRKAAKKAAPAADDK